MKVFSKSSKNNKSNPILPHFNELNTSKQSTKPKGISKVTNYKSKLLQSSNQQSVKFQSTSRIYCSKDYDNYPKSSRDYQQELQAVKLQKSCEIDCKYKHQIQSVPLTSSVEYKNTDKNEGQNRSYSDTIERIQSILCYGNRPGLQQKNTPLDNNKSKKFDFANNSQKSKSTKQKDEDYTQPNFNFSSFKMLADSIKTSNYMNKQNQNNQHCIDKQNRVENNSQKQHKRKQISHYKNSKLLYQHALKPLQRRPQLAWFKIGRKLGRGRFGSVYAAQQIRTGMIFALKMIDLNQVKQQQMENQVIEEIKLQMFMNHPNILKMYGFFIEGQQLCMILEYADQKCLYAYLEQKLQEKQVGYFTRQMIEALKYCHSQFILHRDLKPQNILLCRGVAKLADFGWAAYAPKYKRVTFCGTLDYVPPQILKGDYYDQKADIWSLGVLIYEMSTGRAPFQSKSINPAHTEIQTINKIKKGDLQIPNFLSIELRNLIYSILMTQPDKRLTLEQIQSYTWLRNYKEVGTQISNEVWQFWASNN